MVDHTFKLCLEDVKRYRSLLCRGVWNYVKVEEEKEKDNKRKDKDVRLQFMSPP
jgi:hypothetical protein